MKITGLIASIIFILFAAVQYNDPDPLIWITIYSYAAVVSFLVFRGIYVIPALFAGAAFYLAGSLLYFPDSTSSWIYEEWHNESISMKTPEMELARESFGMMICFAFMATFIAGYFFKHRGSKQKAAIQA